MEHLRVSQQYLITRARLYTSRDLAIPVDLEAALVAEGLSLTDLDTNTEGQTNG